MLKPLKQCLIDVTLFRLLKSLYSQSILPQHTNIPPPNCLHDRIYKTKFLTHTRILFSTFYLSYHFVFSFYTQNHPLIVTVAMLPCHQSPVNCSRNVEGKFAHKVNYITIVIFQTRNLCSYLKHRGLAVSKSRRWWNC